MSKGLQIAIGALAVVGLLGWFATSNVETFRYYETLSEFQNSGRAQQRARVHGFVVIGSIQRNVASQEVRFAVQNEAPHASSEVGRPLQVIYASLETPDLFQDGAEVVVEGELTSGDNAPVFAATNVLAKCPSKFQAATPGETVEPASY